jgi:hypothetical protein
MADGPEPHPTISRLQEIAGSVSSFVAPITLISGILFYFGYVYTTTQYGYFGLDVDTIGLGTQEFIMRSPGPLLTPLLAAGLIAVVIGLAHAAVRRRIEVAPRRHRGDFVVSAASPSAARPQAGWGSASVLPCCSATP